MMDECFDYVFGFSRIYIVLSYDCVGKGNKNLAIILYADFIFYLFIYSFKFIYLFITCNTRASAV